ANADFYISFHHNANRNRWGNWTGVVTYFYKTSTKGRELAKAIQAAIVKGYELKDRCIKTANIIITKETKMPAILVEGGFMYSTIDIKKLRDKNILRRAGKLVALAVAAYYKLKKSGEKTTNQSNPKQDKKANLTVDGYLGP